MIVLYLFKNEAELGKPVSFAFEPRRLNVIYEHKTRRAKMISSGKQRGKFTTEWAFFFSSFFFFFREYG